MAIQQDIHAFTMTISQNVTAARADTQLHIHGVLGIHQMPPNPSRPLPHLNSTISFTGDLLAFEDNVAILGLDDVTELPLPPFQTVPVEGAPELREDIN